MESVLTNFVSDLFGRLYGPFSFRFVLQPLVALFYATRHGLADARAGRPAYFWTITTNPAERRNLLREGLKTMARVMIVGAAIDAIYQLIVFRWIHPVQLVVVVLGLAFLPYVMFRGPIERIASWWYARSGHPTPRPFDARLDEAEQDRTGRKRRA
jgi:hypothetical protein